VSCNQTVISPIFNQNLQVRADTKYARTQLTDVHITEGFWSEPVIIEASASPAPVSPAPVSPSPSSSSGDDDGFPAFAYAIIGVVVALVLLIVVVIIVCLCCRNMGDRYYNKTDYVSNINQSHIG